MPDSASTTHSTAWTSATDLSRADKLARMDKASRSRLLRTLSTEEQAALEHDWTFWGRPSQLPPADDDWVYWLIMAGRGSGKTRAGAEWIRRAKDRSSPLALVGATAADVRDVMVEGPAGLLAIGPSAERPQYQITRRRVLWPNGAEALLFSAEEPDRLRGVQHAAAWCDEISHWQYPQEAWDNLVFGLRLGDKPRACVTTTPRPSKVLRQLLDDPLCRVSRTSSYANKAHLAAEFFAKILARYEGTRLGRQEIYGELLEDVPGALWTHELIERNRLRHGAKVPELIRIVVAIDPAASSGEDADETGIVIAGKDKDGHGYVLGDYSGHYQPVEWARVAVAHYHRLRCDRVVAEVNNGGEMVEHTIRMVDDTVAYQAVHASRGKVVRAEPVSALYEQNRIHHCGVFPELEDQQCSFTVDFDRHTGGSLDRVDALVWALSELLVEPAFPTVLITDQMLRSHQLLPRRGMGGRSRW
jgi:phage terminase large subunit-like protein